MLTRDQVSGPGREWPEGHLCDKADDLASFRALVVYNAMTDEVGLRLDVKVDVLQHNVLTLATLSSTPSGKISASDPLISPSKGVVECVNVRTDRLELAAALRELADKLEQMR